ncbi:MAG: calcium/proton exchanger [Acidobacteria bacterium]|nr:calcium/proton exchanger [Acidobacteriota bacterium]MBV9478271.1 calcium/proton exchanger [Acidobacteriota bacterium]
MKRALTWVSYATIPLALYLQFFATERIVLQFIFSCLAVIPIASWIGHSTEHLAYRMGPTYGALFNATFGNFAEMVIAVFAIRAGLTDVVRASLSGSIVGNLLFVAGLAMLMGGWKRESQSFNDLAAEAQGGQLILAVASAIIPALFFRSAVSARHPELIHEVSRGTAVILLISYAAGLWFSFRTHRHRFAAANAEDELPADTWPVKKAAGILLGASVLMGIVAEGLVHAVHAAGRAWGMNEVFLGFIVLAIVGNAAEHSTAVVLAMRNQMDTALNISMQSSVQIALFVTPVLVFLSVPLGHPLDLLFTPFEILAITIAVAVFAYLCIDGETNWYEGVQLLAVYGLIAVALYFLPATPQPAPAAH